MRQALCPVVIGRDTELGLLTGSFKAAMAGQARALVVLGEAGIGKSRLARHAADMARAQGGAVFTGRAVDSQARVPFRPVAEALRSVLRAAALPEVVGLGPFLPVLARLVPEAVALPAPSGADDTLVLHEGILRLLSGITLAHGGVLVLEDLHWADYESLGVIEYLVDNLGPERLLCVLTCRDDEDSPGLKLCRSLVGRRAAQPLELGRLNEEQAIEMAKACMGSSRIHDSLRALVLRGEGVPFLVEELLASCSGEGADADVVVPVSFADTIRRRVSALDSSAQSILRAAAVIGRWFDWRVAGAVAECSDDLVAADLLGQAVRAQLLDASTTGSDVSFSFRHALTRDAVLGELLPHERARLARRALEVIEASHPDLPGEWCAVGAELAETAWMDRRAAQLLLGCGRRALATGALSTAEAALRRGRRRAGDDLALVVDLDECLTQVLATEGKTDEVFAVGETLLEALRRIEAPDTRLAAVHLDLARAALAATRWGEATADIEAARRLAGPGPGTLSPTIDVLAAHVAIGEGRVEEAVTLATAALDKTQKDGPAEVACEALEVIGRAARGRNLEEARRAFEQSAVLATVNGLVLWRIRALHELGTIDALGHLGVDRLLEARQLAEEAGAMVRAAAIDLELSGTYPFRFEPSPALEAASRCIDIARRLRLGLTLPFALIHAAAAHAVAGRRQEMENLIAEAVALSDGRADIWAEAWGHCRAVASLLEEDPRQAAWELGEAIAWVRNSDCHSAPGCWGPWAILRTIEGTDDEAARREARAAPAMTIPFERALVEYADAIALGREGRATEAVELVEKASITLGTYEKADGYRHLWLRWVAEPAIGDGWGEPARWLREAMAFFEGSGHTRVSSACRRTLTRAGMPVPRRGRGTSAVPVELARMRITSREVDVLRLMAAGLANRDIAERLYLSPRTVEKHVERLMDKTGMRNRPALTELARNAGVAPESGPSPPNSVLPPC